MNRDKALALLAIALVIVDIVMIFNLPAGLLLK